MDLILFFHPEKGRWVKSVRITCWESEREDAAASSRKLHNEEFIVNTLPQITWW
jgi:hypothetical protein